MSSLSQKHRRSPFISPLARRAFQKLCRSEAVPRQTDKKSEQAKTACSDVEATPRLELGVEILQTSALPLGYVAIKFGAGDEARTRYLHLGKVALYRMSYTRIMVPPVGVEPTTRGFSIRCSTY